jgi:hypothetical protein
MQIVWRLRVLLQCTTATPQTSSIMQACSCVASIPLIHRDRDRDHDPEAGGQTNRAKASPLYPRAQPAKCRRVCYANIVTMGWVHQPASLTITAHSIALTQGYHVDSLVDAVNRPSWQTPFTIAAARVQHMQSQACS